MKSFKPVLPIEQRILNFLCCIIRYSDPTIPSSHLYYLMGWNEILSTEHLFDAIVSLVRYQSVEPIFVVESIVAEMQRLNIPEDFYISFVQDFKMLK